MNYELRITNSKTTAKTKTKNMTDSRAMEQEIRGITAKTTANSLTGITGLTTINIFNCNRYNLILINTGDLQHG